MVVMVPRRLKDILLSLDTINTLHLNKATAHRQCNHLMVSLKVMGSLLQISTDSLLQTNMDHHKDHLQINMVNLHMVHPSMDNHLLRSNILLSTASLHHPRVNMVHLRSSMEVLRPLQVVMELLNFPLIKILPKFTPNLHLHLLDMDQCSHHKAISQTQMQTFYEKP